MSQQAAASDVHTCPVCHGAVEVMTFDTSELGVQAQRIEHRITVGEIALSLADQSTAVAVAQIVPAAAKLLLAGVLLGTHDSADPFFTIQDVRDCAEAAQRCDGVSRELRARKKYHDAAEYDIMAKRHRKCAIRIALLLTPEEQQLVHQQIHGGPPPRKTIEVVKS